MLVCYFSSIHFASLQSPLTKTCWLYFIGLANLKGVKKVRSAIYHRIWKYAKQNLAEWFACSIHIWSPIILYNVCNHFWHWMNSQSYIFLGYGLSDVLKNSLFSKYLWHIRHLDSGGSVYDPADHIRWIAGPFSFSLSVRKVLIKPGIAWQLLSVGYPHT